MLELTKYAVELWIKTIATGEFHYAKVLDGQVKPSSYAKLRKIMFELCHAKEPVVESIGRRDGWYRPVQDVPKPIDFTDVEGNKDFPIALPFDLRKYVFIYPRTAIIVAGSKSAGKTGWLYRVVEMNINNPKFNTVLLSNMEGGREQMYDRFMAMGIDLTLVPKFVYPVTDNFHDFIKWPDTLYVIDYIDAPEGTEFYIIGGLISKIRKKLPDNSVAVIGLQKPSSRDIAFGGEGTLKDATLYIAMDSNKLKIVDAKVPADRKVLPKNMQWTFTYQDEGTNFLNIQRCYGKDDTD